MVNHRLVWTQGIFSIDENRIWFVPYWINALCVYNLQTSEMEKIIYFPNQTTDSAGYYNVKKVDHFAVVIPAFEKQIYIYDTDKDVMCTINFPFVTCCCEHFVFSSMLDQNIYLFPAGYEYVLKINLQKKEAVTIKGIDDECKMFVAMTQIDESVFLVNETHKIYVFDMIQESFKLIVCNDSSRKYRTVTHQGTEKLILTDTTGNLYLQYLNDMGCEKEFMSGDIPYDSSACIRNDIFLMPIYEKDYFVKINLNTKDISKIYINSGDNYLKWPHTVFSKVVCKDDFLYFFSTQYQMLFVYKPSTEEEMHYQLEMPVMSDQEIEELLRNKRNHGRIEEGAGQHATLEKFIALAGKDRLNEKQREPVGDSIFRLMQE